MPETFRLLARQAGREQDGMTVKSFLKTVLDLTDHQISAAKFSAGGIRKNGIRVRTTDCVREGDRIEISLESDGRSSNKEGTGCAEPGFFPVNPVMPGISEDSPRILYEDEDVLVSHKPSGMPVHAGRGHFGDSLCEYFGCRYVVGRLDRDTSGIVLLAKNRIACERLQRPGRCRKEYLALVRGTCVPPEDAPWQRIDLPVAKDPAEKNRMMISRDGKRAVTWYRTVRNGSAAVLFPYFDSLRFMDAAKGDESLAGMTCTLLRLRLETGRTHQIRLHMASAGHAVLGDPVYGTALPGRSLALHCAVLSFRHPFRDETVRVRALNENVTNHEEEICFEEEFR